MNNSQLGGAPSRDRTYEAYDQYGNALAITITERVLDVNGGGAYWLTDLPFSDVNTGIFDDQVGMPFWRSGSGTVYQYFSTSIPGTVWNNVPTFVRTGSGDYMVFSIAVSAQSINGKKVYDVKYNGDAGMWNADGSPRLPLCDKK